MFFLKSFKLFFPGTTYICLRLEHSYQWVMVQVVYLLINLGKAVVPFVVAPFLSEDKVNPIPGSSRVEFYPYKPIDWPQRGVAPNRSSLQDVLTSLGDVEGSLLSTTKVGHSYVILAGFSVLIGILYLGIALTNGWRLWERPDKNVNSDINQNTTESDSIWRKTAVLTCFFIMFFLLYGMEAVDLKLLMSFLSEYLNWSKNMGVLASSVYQGVKVLACIITVLVVNRLHPSLILLVDLLFMLTATSLLTASVYFHLGEALIWVTFVLLASGIANTLATVSSWLRSRYRITGMIVGITTLGFGMGLMVLPPLTAYLLGQNGPIMFPLVLLVSSFSSFIVYFIMKLVMKEQCCPQMNISNNTATKNTAGKKDGEKIHLID